MNPADSHPQTLTTPSPKRYLLYWIFLAASWLVLIPNAMGWKTADGNYWILWVFSPLCGLIATILALRDRAWVRMGMAVILGMGALPIGYAAVTLLQGP